jgi:hypothetical protein
MAFSPDKEKLAGNVGGRSPSVLDIAEKSLSVGIGFWPDRGKKKAGSYARFVVSNKSTEN